LPDTASGFIPSVLSAVRALQRRDFDVVYATAPAFSFLVAGVLVGRRLGAPVVLEFRDPWVENAFTHAPKTGRLVRWIADRLESFCLRRTALVVTVTSRARDAYRGRMRRLGLRTPVLSFVNGIDQLADARTPPVPGRRLTVLYSGRLYGARAPEPVFHALGRVRRMADVPPFEFRVVGTLDRAEASRLRVIAGAEGLADVVGVSWWVPFAEAQRLNADADVLLVLAEELTMQVPNKLFDYFGARAPIVAVAEPAGETAALMHHIGGHFVVPPGDIEALVTALSRALQRATTRPTVGDDARLRDLRATSSMTSLIGALESTFGTPARPVRALDRTPVATNSQPAGDA
jgi:glycosyltransferase involved in cell wall biosynthesis